MKQRRHKISMTTRDILNCAFSNTRTADKERDVDIFFYAARFTGREPVLADVEAVVGCINQISVFQYLGVFAETVDDRPDEVVDGLQGLEARAVPSVVVRDF